MREDISSIKSQEEWEEKAINNSKECWKSFILSRVEIALIKIDKKQEYKKLKQKQEIREEKVDKLLKKLKRKERLFIQRHYEKQTIIENYELKETYKQGLKDGIQFLIWMDVLQIEDWM